EFGTGTWHPSAALGASYDLGPVALRGPALTMQVLYENGKGYQSGDRYAAGVSALSPLGTRAWRFEAGLEALGETAETWNGMVYDDDGNQGRFDRLAAASAGRSIGGGVEAFVGVKVPIVIHRVGVQLEYAGVLEHRR